MIYATGDTFNINDICSPFHEWSGKVIEVLEDGYYCMVEFWVDGGVHLTFAYFEESQMASKVYI